jgi:hypothetical protein
VPAGIGIMNAASTVGGSALPWLAGTIAQSAGMRVLLPFTIVLALPSSPSGARSPSGCANA